jgi:hypothetical protein
MDKDERGKVVPLLNTNSYLIWLGKVPVFQRCVHSLDMKTNNNPQSIHFILSHLVYVLFRIS